MQFFVIIFFPAQCFRKWNLVLRPAEKRAPPPRRKQALPRPAPQKLTKPAGCSGAKLTINYTDYAHIFGLRVGE